MPTIPKLYCTHCREDRSLPHFTPSRRHKNGNTGICQTCIRTINGIQESNKLGPGKVSRRITQHIKNNKEGHKILFSTIFALEQRIKRLEQPSYVPIGI